MLANRPQYDEAARTWLAVAKGHEDDAAVLGNAGAFLTGAILNTTYRDRGEALLKRARSLEPDRARWALALGTLYEMDMVRFGPVPDPGRKAAARKALTEFEAGYRLTPEPERAKLRPEGRHLYEHMAVTAMACEDLAKAGEYAEKLLATARPEKDDWNYGNAVFEAHTILGRVALSRDDIRGAERHLLESGRTPGSPQLNSFGPNMILADRLLERGVGRDGPGVPRPLREVLGLGQGPPGPMVAGHPRRQEARVRAAEPTMISQPADGGERGFRSRAHRMLSRSAERRGRGESGERRPRATGPSGLATGGHEQRAGPHFALPSAYWIVSGPVPPEGITAGRSRSSSA